MDAIISTFHIDWKIIIAQAVNFWVVFVVLYIFALKPLSKLMAERSEKISQGLEDAKQNEALLKETSANYEEALAKARMEASTIFQAGKKEAEKKTLEMMEEAKRQTEAVVASGRKTLEADKIKIVEEAKKEISVLAVKAAEKILLGTEGHDEKGIKDLKNL